MIAHHRAIRYWLSSCRRGWLHPSWLPLQVRNSSSFAFYFLLNCSPCAKCKARPFAAITRRCVRRKNRAKRLPNFYRLLTPWTVKGVQSCFQRSRVPSSKWWAGVPIIWHVIAVDAADICQHQGDREDSAPLYVLDGRNTDAPLEWHQPPTQFHSCLLFLSIKTWT